MCKVGFISIYQPFLIECSLISDGHLFCRVMWFQCLPDEHPVKFGPITVTSTVRLSPFFCTFINFKKRKKKSRWKIEQKSSQNKTLNWKEKSVCQIWVKCTCGFCYNVNSIDCWNETKNSNRKQMLWAFSFNNLRM